MKYPVYIVLCWLLLLATDLRAQSTNPAPYCLGGATSGNCSQPGLSNAPNNSVNDFINDFYTCGANNEINNLNSGCNAQANNYIYYSGVHTMTAAPGQLITCRLRSGITFNQGFAIFIDWNQNGIFDVPGERVAATNNAPPASTWVSLAFTIPTNQPVGTYRMRVRSTFAAAGTGIQPCGQQMFSETEDYDVVIVANNNPGVISTTLSSNSPICSGQTLSLSAVSNPTSSQVSWAGPAGFTSTVSHPALPNAATQNSGIYTVTIGSGNCPFVGTVTVAVAPPANFVIPQPVHNICQGGNIAAQITQNLNPASFNYSWTTNSPHGGSITSPSNQNPIIQPALLSPGTLSATVLYSITVTPTVNASCSITQTMVVNISNPAGPTLTMPPPLCDIFSPVQLTATPVGGTWGGNPAVSATGLFSPTLAGIGTNTITYSVMNNGCMTQGVDTVSVSRYYSPALSSSITLSCVQDAPFNLMNIVQFPLTGSWSGTQVSNNMFNPAGLSTGIYHLTYSTTSAPIASVCPASTVLAVPVFNPPVPIIDPIAPLCNTSPSVVLNATPPGGVWSGNPGVTSSGIRHPSLNLVGTNTVTYTAGQGTCVASSAAVFHMSEFNTAAMKGVVPALCANTITPFNLMSIVQNTNGTWSGTGISSPNFFHPHGLATNNYQLVYANPSVPNATLCPDARTIHVSVLNPPVPNISSVGPLCSSGSPVQLTVSPGSGHWVSTPYLSSGGVLTPSLCMTGDNPVQYVTGTSTCYATQTRMINIEAFVSAKVQWPIQDLCNTSQPLNLSPFPLNSSGYWAGPGIVGNNFNPAATGAGNFVLNYHTASVPSGLCPDKATVSVRVFSLAAPVISQAGPFCDLSAPVQLQVSPVGGIFSGPVTGVVSLNGVFNPAAALTGDNYINYTISVGPCEAYTQTRIRVKKFVSASFSKVPQEAYCKNQEPFNLNTLVTHPGGRWSGGPPVVGHMFYPSLASTEQDNEVFYEIPDTLCPDQSSALIRVVDLPTVAITSNLYSGCAPLEVELNTPSTNAGKGVWNITDGTVYPYLRTVHRFTAPGTYSVLFTYERVEGCSTQVTLARPIVVYETPVADFAIASEEVSMAEPVTQLTNLSTNLYNNRYLWETNAILEEPYKLHPELRFPAAGRYQVTLTASTINDCKDVATRTIEVKNELSIYIPNSFTPNFDGKNDRFIPVYTLYGLDPKTFEMEIFDRWGHRVHRTRDIELGWDGSIGGEMAKEDVYVYLIHYKDLDGQLHSKTGHITLIR